VTDVRSGELRVDDRGSFTTSAPMSVEVTVPSLDGMRLSGTGEVRIDGVRGKEFMVRMPGSGTLTANGAVARLDASLGGLGEVDLRSLAADEVVAGLAGSGRILVNASHSLDASVAGVGSILYAGHPGSVTRTITGVGTIQALQPAR
jgi:hypothetical protein